MTILQKYYLNSLNSFEILKILNLPLWFYAKNGNSYMKT
jgi:hypothetical protein